MDFYLEGLKYYDEGEYELAAASFERAALQGHAEAQFSLGVSYDLGKGVDQSYENAVEWYTKAAEQGHRGAQDRLGDLYSSGNGVPQSYEKAVEWYTKAAEQGDIDAQFSLGEAYFLGNGVPQSEENAIEWFEKAALQEHASAQYVLGLAYEDGRGTPQSPEKAVYWYLQAAEQGHADAQEALGICYEFGKGVEPSAEKAAKWYEKAAEQGNAKAQFGLGRCYEFGSGVKRSREMAFRLYERSAAQGYSGAQTFLGRCYLEGIGTQPSPEKAVEWFTKAAEQGEVFAQEYLSECYRFGIGVEVNEEHANVWRAKAVEQHEEAIKEGDLDSLIYLGLLYLGNDNCEGIDPERGFAYLSEAMAKGSSLAAVYIGACYWKGVAVRKNYVQAVKYFLLAKERGVEDYDSFNVDHYLGVCYHSGLGVERDLAKAKEYYEAALATGYNCRYALEMLERDILLDGYYKECLAEIPQNDPSRERNARRNAIQRMKSADRGGLIKYIDDLLAKGYENRLDKRNAIEMDLRREFGELWDHGLKENAKKSLVMGLLIYSDNIEMGPEGYEEDFSPVINQLSKAYETELKEYCFKGYLRYLKSEEIPCDEFVKPGALRQSPLIRAITDKEGKVTGYEYNDEESGAFTMGSFYYVIESQPSTMRCGDPRRDKERGKHVSRMTLGDKMSERTVNPHFLAFADRLFADDAFSCSERENEIVNYLIDLSTDTSTIMNYRNPGSHETTMRYDQAAVAADYLVMVHKVINHFLEKIDPKYREGYRPE